MHCYSLLWLGGVGFYAEAQGLEGKFEKDRTRNPGQEVGRKKDKICRVQCAEEQLEKKWGPNPMQELNRGKQL